MMNFELGSVKSCEICFVSASTMTREPLDLDGTIEQNRGYFYYSSLMMSWTVVIDDITRTIGGGT